MKATLNAVLAALVLATGMTAEAAVVSASQNQTVDGQNFTFALAAPDYVASTASKMTLTVQGDFNGESGEFVTVWIEGINLGTFGAFSAGAYNLVDYRTGTNNFNALKFSLDFLLSSSATNGYMADGDLDVLIDFNSGVTSNCGWSNTSNCVINVDTAPFAQVSFDYVNTAVVPEPATLALLGAALAGLAASRRRKSV